jgi:transcriptional regulator with XRE-family HTH domain
MDADDAPAIGQRVRMIRRRRGLSLDVVGGLAGITGAYLSMLERGLRGFNRRGLVEDLAAALGCAVADLTGQPYLAPDRAPAQGRSALWLASARTRLRAILTWRSQRPDADTTWPVSMVTPG